MSVLITGAGGFIGSYLANHYIRLGREDVYALGAPQEMVPVGSGSAVRMIPLDTRLPSPVVTELLANVKPRLVIHAAGKGSVPQSLADPAADFLAGPPVVFDLLDAIRASSPHTKLVFLSSAAVYGKPETLPVGEQAPLKPISPYGFHKLQSELLVREFAQIYGIETLSLRIFSSYGAGLKKQFLWDFCRKASNCSDLKLQGTGAETRDFIHISDVVRCVDHLDRHMVFDGSAINVCSGTATPIAALASMMAAHFPHRFTINFSGQLPRGVPDRWQGDDTLLRGMGFRCAMTMEAGVADYVRWYHSLT